MFVGTFSSVFLSLNHGDERSTGLYTLWVLLSRGSFLLSFLEVNDFIQVSLRFCTTENLYPNCFFRVYFTTLLNEEPILHRYPPPLSLFLGVPRQKTLVEIVIK